MSDTLESLPPRSNTVSSIETAFPRAKSTSSQQLILACIDGSNVTQSVCDYAFWYANKLATPIALLHTLQVPKSRRHDLSGAIGLDSRRHLMADLTKLDEQTARLANKHGEALLKDAQTHILNKHNSTKVCSHLRHGKLLSAIEHFGDKPRLVILGRRGQGHQNQANQQSNTTAKTTFDRNHDGLTIGSQIETIARAVHHPILICSDPFELPTSYMLAFDGSPTAKKAVATICASQVARGISGHLVMVGQQDTTNENELYQAQTQMQQAGLKVDVNIITPKSNTKSTNDIVNALINYRVSNNISMIAIGAYGHSKLRRLFVGSTTTKLLAQTTAPVLMLR